MTQRQLQEILESFCKKGNEQNDIKTIDFVNEMILKIQSLSSATTANKK